MDIRVFQQGNGGHKGGHFTEGVFLTFEDVFFTRFGRPQGGKIGWAPFSGGLINFGGDIIGALPQRGFFRGILGIRAGKKGVFLQYTEVVLKHLGFFRQKGLGVKSRLIRVLIRELVRGGKYP